MASAHARRLRAEVDAPGISARAFLHRSGEDHLVPAIALYKPDLANRWRLSANHCHYAVSLASPQPISAAVHRTNKSLKDSRHAASGWDMARSSVTRVRRWPVAKKRCPSIQQIGAAAPSYGIRRRWLPSSPMGNETAACLAPRRRACNSGLNGCCALSGQRSRASTAASSGFGMFMPHDEVIVGHPGIEPLLSGRE